MSKPTPYVRVRVRVPVPVRVSVHVRVRVSLRVHLRANMHAGTRENDGKTCTRSSIQPPFNLDDASGPPSFMDL